jgi:putative flippase GtrA
MVGLVIDVGLFNLLRVTALSPEVLEEGPVIAKVVSTSVAIAANWVGNRLWTFRREERAHPVGEGLRFAAVSITAMGIPLTCLWVSHYLLGFTSLLADNVSTNVVGLGLGMVFRFWLYRTWVFAEPPATSGTAQGPIVPSGGAPLLRIQAVAPVDDRPRPHD